MLDDKTVSRYLAKIRIDPNGCHIWTGKIGENGYGYFWYQGKNRLVHRFTFEHFIGPIPEGLQVEHKCHTNDTSCRLGSDCPHRRCVNREHLEALTPRENIMRSSGVAPINAAKVVCLHGHPLTLDNVYLYPSGERGCRTCRAQACRDYKERNHPKRGQANTRKTECPRGHPYDAENTFINVYGRRVCRTCRRIRARKQTEA